MQYWLTCILHLHFFLQWILKYKIAILTGLAGKSKWNNKEYAWLDSEFVNLGAADVFAKKSYQKNHPIQTDRKLKLKQIINESVSVWPWAPHFRHRSRCTGQRAWWWLGSHRMPWPWSELNVSRPLPTEARGVESSRAYASAVGPCAFVIV
jgi:hypothetical protein